MVANDGLTIEWQRLTHGRNPDSYNPPHTTGAVVVPAGLLPMNSVNTMNADIGVNA
jgi:hypothetical protein